MRVIVTFIGRQQEQNHLTWKGNIHRNREQASAMTKKKKKSHIKISYQF